ncbi:MAG: hypothetical protein ACOYOE_08950 [Chlorobium sp.]
MKTKAEMIDILEDARQRGVQFVTYGDGDLGVPVAIDEAIKDFEAMEDQQIGEGDWFPCDNAGTIQ